MYNNKIGPKKKISSLTQAKFFRSDLITRDHYIGNRLKFKKYP